MPEILDEAGIVLYSEAGLSILDELGLYFIDNLAWRVLGPVTVSANTKWNLKAQVNKLNLSRYNDYETQHIQSIIEFNTYITVSKSQDIYYRVDIDPAGPVVLTQEIEFNVKSRVSKLQSTTFNVSATKNRGVSNLA